LGNPPAADLNSSSSDSLDYYGKSRSNKKNVQRNLDENTSAYKNIDQVIALETDLVKVITKLEPLAVIKG